MDRPSWLRVSQTRNATTAAPAHRISGSPVPMRYGLPHFDGRDTTTVFGGSRHPLVLRSWIRFGFICQSHRRDGIASRF